MNWTLQIHRSVSHSIRYLPKPIFEQVWPSILNLKKDQYPLGAKQVTGFEDVYEYTIVGYRVVYQLQEEVLIIRIIRLRQP